jgi:hypothetical protein
MENLRKTRYLFQIYIVNAELQKLIQQLIQNYHSGF